MKQLAVAGDHHKIMAVIEMLVQEFIRSAQANQRKVSLSLSLLFWLGFIIMYVAVLRILIFFFFLAFLSGWIDRTCCSDGGFDK